MPVELVIAPEAELDIAEAYVWYEGRRAGLGEEFLSSVDACLESIRRRLMAHAGLCNAISMYTDRTRESRVEIPDRGG
jgi:hypothetical protein